MDDVESMSFEQRMRWARSREVASSTQRLVLMVLTTYVSADGWCQPSITTLVEATGLSTRTVQRTLGELVAAGLVRRTQRVPGGPVTTRVMLGA